MWCFWINDAAVSRLLEPRGKLLCRQEFGILEIKTTNDNNIDLQFKTQSDKIHEKLALKY